MTRSRSRDRRPLQRITEARLRSITAGTMIDRLKDKQDEAEAKLKDLRLGT
jgi:hypothetical protein